MKIHGKIQKKLAEQYREQGYNTLIETSIPIGFGKFFIVDIFAEKSNERIIIEKIFENKEKEIDLDTLIDSRGLILANSGAGKILYCKKNS